MGLIINEEDEEKMKGVIALCLKDLVCNNYGKDRWEKVMETAGLKKNMLILPNSDVEDSTVMAMVEAVCKELGISPAQAADAFGDYWVNNYSQQLYSGFYKGKTAKEFLLNMDNVHVRMTKQMEKSNPPRFEFEQKGENTLIMHYSSHRGLIDFLIGIVKGVGKYYNQPMLVTKLDNKRVQIIFQ